MLKELKIPCQSSSSGEEAISLVKDRIINNKPPFKLIFLDYSMPFKDGPQTAVEVLDICKKAG